VNFHANGYRICADQMLPDTCQVAISTAVAITVSWRHIRIALDTLFNVCVSHPLLPATGGRARYGPQPSVSRRSRLKGRQANNGTGEQCGIDQCGLLEDPDISGKLSAPALCHIPVTDDDENPGLNALPPPLNITVYNDPQISASTSALLSDSCAWRAILAGRSVDTCPIRPPERHLGDNSSFTVP